MDERVILVDAQDGEIGTAEKLQAHREARLHRAFSVYIFNPQGDMLLQQRALGKYHTPGLWTNACCSHPRPGEDVEAAAHRRLRQEMGFDVPLRKAFAFTYQAPFANGLTEHEYDHVFLGTFSGQPQPNPAEAAGCRWAPPGEVLQDLQQHPERYTPWFRIALERVIAHAKGASSS
ncbi:MAG: isopentenyl-diphosphate Delta-isomerase [Candidatus Aenigmarchaeota archaeon]|nr:isopentenyl-diphosphate Delta-isomerase [Candidatus Aenigmarchaeota archaeon]